MRGRRDPQATVLGFVDLEKRTPKGYPPRPIKTVEDEALDWLSPEFSPDMLCSRLFHQRVGGAEPGKAPTNYDDPFGAQMRSSLQPLSIYCAGV